MGEPRTASLDVENRMATRNAGRQKKSRNRGHTALCIAVVLILLLSLFGLSALALDTGWQNPSQDAGEWKNGFYAYLDNADRAEGELDEVHQYWGYGLALGQGVDITGIEVRLDVYRGNDTTASAELELSWDGGASWTSTGNQITDLTEQPQTLLLGWPSDAWGRAWTAAELMDANFRMI